MSSQSLKNLTIFNFAQVRTMFCQHSINLEICRNIIHTNNIANPWIGTCIISAFTVGEGGGGHDRTVKVRYHPKIYLSYF